MTSQTPGTHPALVALKEAIDNLTREQIEHTRIGRELEQLEDEMPLQRESAIQRLQTHKGYSYTAAKENVGTDPVYAALRERRRKFWSEREAAGYRVVVAERLVTCAELTARYTLFYGDGIASGALAGLAQTEG